MISAPANAASTNSDPATIAHTADRFVAHHMNLDASKAQTPAATMTKTAVSISSRHIRCSHRSQIQALWLGPLACDSALAVRFVSDPLQL